MRASLVAVFGCLFAVSSAAAAIHGVVLSDSGAPVANARVAAYSVESMQDILARTIAARPRPILAKTTSDRDGVFTLDIAGYGVVVLSAAADDFSPTFASAVLGDSDVTLTIDHAEPADWTVRSSAGPVRDARILGFVANGVIETKSGAAGKFAASNFGGFLVLAPDFAPKVVQPETLGGERVVSLDRGVAIHGQVIGPDRAPVPAARILVNSMPLATTAPDGMFTIMHAPREPYMLEADAGALTGTTDSMTRPVLIKMQTRIALTGVVRDTEKHPLRGIAIIAGSRSGFGQTVSDANGDFTLWLVPANYEIAVDGEYRLTETVDVRKPLAHDLVVKRAPLAAGIVRMADGTPVAGAHVEMAFDTNARAADLSHETITKRDGRFRLPLPSERAYFEVTKEGVPPAEAEVRRDGETVIVVPKGIDAVVQVNDAHGKGIGGVSVTAMRANRATASRIDAVTDANGRAALRLAADGWTVFFTKSGYTPNSVANVSLDEKSAPITARLASAVSVRGRIVRSDGSGVAGMFVSLEDVTQAQTTGDDGAFAFPNVQAGAHELHYMSNDGNIGSAPIVAPADNARITLPDATVLHGRVIDAAGAPVTEYTVSAGTEDVDAMPKNISDPEGRFELSTTATGAVEVNVSAEGFVRTNKTVSVAAGKAVDPIVVTLSRGRTVRGKITNAAGEPLADVDVGAQSYVREPPHTAADGTYELHGVGPDATTIRFAKTGFVPVRRAVPAADGDVRIDAQLSPGIAITGRVLTADGKAVPHAQVSASSAAAGAEYAQQQTDDDGAFTMSGLLPARYDFSATAEAMPTAHLSDVDVAATHEIVLRMPAPSKATITGVVSAVANASAVMVQASTPTGEDVNVQADSSGKFRIENAPTGIVRVIAVAFAGGRSRMSNPVTADVAPNSETRVELTFPEQFTINGRVLLNGSPLAGAALEFSREDSAASAQAMSGDGGAYEATLSAGHYQITVKRPSTQNDDRLERDILAAGTVDINIDLATLLVTVVDSATSAPIEGATVSTRMPGSETHTMPRGTTPASGQLSISVPAEVKQLVVERNGYATAIADISSSSVTVPLTRTDGAVVRLIDARDGGTLSEYAIARDDAGRVLASSSEAGPDGTKRLPLLPGTYRFSASASEYGSQTVKREVPSAEIRIALPRGGKLLLQSHAPMTATARLIEPDGEEYVRCWCSGIAEIRIAGRSTLVDSIAPGSYALEITPAGGKPRRIPVSVIEGETTPVNLD